MVHFPRRSAMAIQLENQGIVSKRQQSRVRACGRLRGYDVDDRLWIDKICHSRSEPETKRSSAWRCSFVRTRVGSRTYWFNAVNVPSQAAIAIGPTAWTRTTASSKEQNARTPVVLWLMAEASVL